MVKSLLRRVGAVLGLSLLLGTAAAEARAPQVARPALWEVSDPDTTVYLFGTIHLLPDQLQWRTPAFEKAVAASDQLVVETVVDQQDPRRDPGGREPLGLKQGLPPIAQRVPASKVPQLRAAIAKSGVPEKFFDQMKSWLAAIKLLGVQFREMGLKGKRAGGNPAPAVPCRARPIGELETNVQQFAYFDRLPEKAQRELLEGAIEPSGRQDKEFSGMLVLGPVETSKALPAPSTAISQSPELRQSHDCSAMPIGQNGSSSGWASPARSCSPLELATSPARIRFSRC